MGVGRGRGVVGVLTMADKKYFLLITDHGKYILLITLLENKKPNLIDKVPSSLVCYILNNRFFWVNKFQWRWLVRMPVVEKKIIHISLRRPHLKSFMKTLDDRRLSRSVRLERMWRSRDDTCANMEKAMYWSVFVIYLALIW